MKPGKVVLEAVKANIRYFRDTGAEYGEAKLSDPKWERGQRTVRIYWEGEKTPLFRCAFKRERFLWTRW